MTKVQVAAGLLEIEVLLMMSRSQVLQDNRDRFVELMLESRAKLTELVAYLVTDPSEPLTELFVAEGKG